MACGHRNYRERRRKGFGPEGLETAYEIRGAFWELNSCGEMFLYDKGVISHSSPSGVIH